MKRITQKISFGVMASFAALSALMLPFTSFAAVTTWQATAPSHIAFICGGGEYDHTINTINQAPDGTLTGTGTYDPVTSYTWNLTGSVSGDTVSMVITYTGTQAGSVYNLAGAIAPDGSVLGTSDSNCQTFTMPAGSFIHPAPTSPSTKDDCKKGRWEGYHFKNQGQCVRFIETGKDSR